VRAGMAARGERIAAILAGAAKYDPAIPYTQEDLNRRIQDGEDAAALAPEQRAKIEQALAPWRGHLANLQAGRTFYAGAWRSPEELHTLEARAQEAARLNAFSASLDIPLDTQIISAGTVNGTLGAMGAAIGLPVLLGLVLVFRGRRLTGALFILLPAAGGVCYAALLFSKDVPWLAAPDGSGTDASSNAVTRILYAGTQAPSPGTGEPGLHVVSESEVNGFLARHVRLQGPAAAGAINLEKLAVRFQRDGAVFCETAEWRGRTLRIRQAFQVVQDAAGKPVVTAGAVEIGDAPLPEPVQHWLRDSLEPPLARFFNAHDPLAAYALASLTAAGPELVANTPPPAPVVQATPAPAPAATPMPAATPTPTAAMAEATPEPEPAEVEPPPLSAAGQTPGPDNSFYVYAIWDEINTVSDTEIAQQMDRLRDQFGTGNRFHHAGFAFILSGNEERLRTICSLARQKNLAIGVILGAQTKKGAQNKEVQEDFRAVQWRLGAGWREADAASSLFATPSRYCKSVRDALTKAQKQRCDLLARVMQSYPGVITCIDSTIEEELAGGGGTDDNLLADYSPFAVTEFRDWLRHTGQYDADHGKYAGQGAAEQITGPYVFAGGKLRSPFYTAADPNATAGGSSFNTRFGTNFTAWTLKYWDLEAFPERITDEQFNPMPESGKGFTDGGFDAPRKRGASLWWRTWSWDYQDCENRYPPGNPAAPAFGFRQVMVHDFVRDMLAVAIQARLPANLLFAHQIPGELVGAERDRTSASPIWTGFLPFDGTVGVTRFGFIDPKMVLSYTRTVPQSRGWGIFEWHPMPDADPKDPKLYQKASENLQAYYRGKCHHLFAGWWSMPGEDSKQTKTFPLADSGFAKAIKDFLASRPDQPYPGTPR
jgi:hypothetical protein